MSATPPPCSPSQSVEPDDVHMPLPPSIQPQTPEKKLNAARPAPDITPLARGTSIRQKQEGNTDRIDGYSRNDYDDYVREDLKGRVFVDYEVFMKYVLHVPEDWRIKWEPIMKTIRTDPAFQKQHEDYCRCCNDPTARELLFYQPLANAANAILRILSQSQFDGMNSGIPQTYCVGNYTKLQGGIFNKANLSPDLVVFHEECDTTKPKGPKPNPHWANALHILEVKPYGNAICDGNNMPRLVFDEIDPKNNHAPPTNLSRSRGRMTASLTTSLTPSGSNPASSKNRKRSADESSKADQRTGKKSRTKSALGQTEAEEDRSTSKPETQHQLHPAHQVCRYLLEMFSVPLLRSHATVSLVDRDRLQLYHANRSVILVSSAINFSGGDGLEKFIATIIAFRCLSPEQNGILETLSHGNANLIRNPKISSDDKVVQKGNKLIFTGNEPDDKFEVELGEIISRDPAAVGRSTAVVGATSDKWPGVDLVVKASWPGSRRVPETVFLKKAHEEAEKTEGGWATSHLPRLFHARDVDFDQHSTLKSVARLFEDAKFLGGKFVYEPRTLRVIIQERLHSLKSLTNARDIGQVFLDIACIHRWLLDNPGILHRDLSLNNIMCRIIKKLGAREEVYGVLTDYDLSSWAASLKNDYTKTSQQRTGTPPFMAHELLKGTSDIHLYRHDVESLFYIMLLTCARHQFDLSKEARWPVVMRGGTLPYQKWFNGQDYDTLGKLKGSFFTEMEPIELSPAFEDIRPWLADLQYRFSEGFEIKNNHERRKRREELPPFEDETLRGTIDYSSLITPTHRLTGELKGLTIRYNPDTVQADA